MFGQLRIVLGTLATLDYKFPLKTKTKPIFQQSILTPFENMHLSNLSSYVPKSIIAGKKSVGFMKSDLV